MSVFEELPSIFFAEMKAERRSEFAFLTDSSDVTVGIMSRPLRLLIRSSLMILHWVVSNNVLACSNTVSKNISFIVFATSIMNFSVREINDNLEAMAKQLYDYWFVQFDFPNEEGNPYKSSGGAMMWNEKLKRMIPQGWNNGLLSDVAIITMGQSPDGSSYNELGEGSIFYQGSTDFGLRFPSIRQYTTSPNRCANKGDILMSVRAPVGALNIANNDCCIGRGLSALSSKIGSITHLYYLMNDFRLKFEGMNSAGTTFGSITKDELFNLPVVIPTKSVISEFEKVCEPIFDKQMIIGEEINVLTKQRDELLPLLMNGQASVNSD